MDNNKCSVIVLSNRALKEIKTETNRKSPAETGGILLGKIIDDQWYVIATTKPGPNSIFQISYFEYDQEFVTREANRISKEYELELELLGLWHRHPGSMDTFSSTDDGTNTLFAELNSRGAISGLVNLDPDFRLTMYHVDSPLKYEKIEIFTDEELIPLDFLKRKPVIEEVIPSSNTENLEKKIPLISKPPTIHKTENINKYNTSQKYYFLLSIFSLILLFYFLIIGGNDKSEINSSNIELPNKINNKVIKDTNKLLISKEIKFDSTKVKLIKDSAETNLETIKIDTSGENKNSFKKKLKETDTILMSDSLNNVTILKQTSKKEKLNSLKINNLEISKKEKQNTSLIRSNSFTSILLLINMVIFAFLAFINNKIINNKTVIFLGLGFGFFAFLILPFLSDSLSLINRASMSLFVILIITLILFLIKIKNANKKHFWYEKKSAILEAEKSLIHSNFPDFKLDTIEEDGRLFWVGELISNKGNPYQIQIVYDNKFDNDNNKIYTYFINPTLSELQVDNNPLPYTYKDASGNLQLKFDVSKKKNTALYTIRLTIKWINLFESWLNKEMPIGDFKI